MAQEFPLGSFFILRGSAWPQGRVKYAKIDFVSFLQIWFFNMMCHFFPLCYVHIVWCSPSRSTRWANPPALSLGLSPGTCKIFQCSTITVEVHNDAQINRFRGKRAWRLPRRDANDGIDLLFRLALIAEAIQTVDNFKLHPSCLRLQTCLV